MPIREEGAIGDVLDSKKEVLLGRTGLESQILCVVDNSLELLADLLFQIALIADALKLGDEQIVFLVLLLYELLGRDGHLLQSHQRLFRLFIVILDKLGSRLEELLLVMLALLQH